MFDEEEVIEVGNIYRVCHKSTQTDSRLETTMTIEAGNICLYLYLYLLMVIIGRQFMVILYQAAAGSGTPWWVGGAEVQNMI